MELKRIKIHNFRSIIDSDIDVRDFTMLVGANNAGKSNFMNALRCFYGDLRWNENDFPKKGYSDQESWIELSFELALFNERGYGENLGGRCQLMWV